MRLLEFKRRSYRLSQEALGRVVGLKQADISQFERGLRRPWPRALRDLAKFFLNPGEDAEGLLREVPVGMADSLLRPAPGTPTEDHDDHHAHAR